MVERIAMPLSLAASWKAASMGSTDAAKLLAEMK